MIPLPKRKVHLCKMFSKSVGRLTLIIVTINWPFMPGLVSFLKILVRT